MTLTVNERAELIDIIDDIQEQIDGHKLDLKNLEFEKYRYESVLKSMTVCGEES